MGLIDSGADNALFSAALATQLGLPLDPSKYTQGQGAGSDFRKQPLQVILAVCGKRFTAEVDFSPEWNRPFGLLGREAFFTEFAIGFDERNQQMLYRALPPIGP